ncbi:MAG: 2-dehydropantoate 2-reductase [Verrucomicrobiota bacterium]
MANIKKIAVVGSGAIGSYYGAVLARAGEDVHFLMRSDYEAVRERGLRIETLDETFTLDSVQASRSTAEIGECDLVLVAVKTTANEALPDLLRPLVGEHTHICTLQNGLGNAEFLAKHFGAERIIGGLCFICLNRTEPGVIKNTNRGALTLAPHHEAAREATEALCEKFKRTGMRAAVMESLNEAIWRKLVWNVPFNGLSIAAGCLTTDHICADPHLESLAHKLMKEVQAAALAQGHKISDNFLEKEFERTRPMGPYKPSSLIDFVEGREVEVEAIWGEPLRRAQSLGTPTPHLETLYLLIKGQVAQRGKGLGLHQPE